MGLLRFATARAEPSPNLLQQLKDLIHPDSKMFLIHLDPFGTTGPGHRHPLGLGEPLPHARRPCQDHGRLRGRQRGSARWPAALVGADLTREHLGPVGFPKTLRRLRAVTELKGGETVAYGYRKQDFKEIEDFQTFNSYQFLSILQISDIIYKFSFVSIG